MEINEAQSRKGRHEVNISFTDEEAGEIIDSAASRKLSVKDYLRKVILDSRKEEQSIKMKVLLRINKQSDNMMQEQAESAYALYLERVKSFRSGKVPALGVHEED